MGHAESHRSFNNGVCAECADLGKEQGIYEERERIYAWLAILLPVDTFETLGGLIREALYGQSEYPTKPEAG